MKVFIILPARLNSSRLHNKLIRKIGDKTLIEHMIISAKKIKNSKIIVSTDSTIIQDYAIKNNVDSLLSKKKFNNGTERSCFTAKKFNAKHNDIIINLQADEFNINIIDINNLIKYLKSSKQSSIATLFYKTKDKSEYNNKNNVKLIIDKNNKAITFTRNTISSMKTFYLIHVGVYAFKFKSLLNYSEMKLCDYEKNESLEQLRLIWNNVPIDCLEVKKNQSIGINSARDLKKARELYEN